jgi:primosomal protein N' (replication factor Y)
MYYYEVLVSSQRYHGADPLTYSSDQELVEGVIVSAPLGSRTVSGFVIKRTTKPSFAVKPIVSVIDGKPLPKALIALHDWMKDYYPGPLGLITQLFLPAGLGTKSKLKRSDKHDKHVEPPKLTAEQVEAVSKISQGKSTSYLLHGETGSGKTRVYIELTKTTLSNGKSVIILTPEIGLTPQISDSFRSAFPGKVTVLHSEQTTAERRDNWESIRNSDEAQIVIGPRSALFAPLANVGLIVVDECHEPAYKQDQMPYYQTTRAAAQLAHLHEAKLVMGSATPLISDYFAFKEKKLPIVRMESVAKGSSEVSTEVVDLKDRQHFSKSPWLSDPLLAHIEKALQDGYQSLVFLNRRGTARVVICGNCGWQASCPRCDLPLTYHGDKHHLQCHTCGFTDRAPVSCPECKKPEIEFKSIGTKTLVNEVSRIFPEAAVARFDSDNPRAESMVTNFADIASGKVDILVGTQVLSKGLDLPLLQVIGVVLADTGLYFPDFSAEERTYQTLRQVIGRVGRGHTTGNVVLQSYNPSGSALTAVTRGDYAAFYDSQLKERELYHFPPYFFVLKMSVERAVQSSARKTAHELAASLMTAGLAVEIVGPAPAFVEKAHNKYRWQIVVKAKQRSQLTAAIGLLSKNCSYNIDPTNLL